MPPIDGLDRSAAWNNRDATTPSTCPQSMIVLGGGPVGSELAQAWSSLGTEVTLVEGGEHLLSREEPFAGEEVAASLREQLRRRRPHRDASRIGGPGGPGVVAS